MAKPSPEVQVELYIRGKGPVRVFKETLKGWDQKRLDLDRIMRAEKLKAVYAFSLSDGRGNRLLANPRNGLSFLSYSGRPDVLIRIDGEPFESYSFMIAKVLLGFVLILGLAALALSESLTEWLSPSRESGRSYVVVLLCFVTMLYTQLVWRPMRKSRTVNLCKDSEAGKAVSVSCCCGIFVRIGKLEKRFLYLAAAAAVHLFGNRFLSRHCCDFYDPLLHKILSSKHDLHVCLYLAAAAAAAVHLFCNRF
ncbi:hypothetical protein L7F22_007403 [Adiantum nelumboides]|nr:hypothetical protein [Adiantum nelumboides]